LSTLPLLLLLLLALITFSRAKGICMANRIMDFKKTKLADSKA